MTEKRFMSDVTNVLDTWFGYMGENEPTEREIKENDYLLIGIAESQSDAESICEKLNELNDEVIEYCNFSLHDLLDKKNKENEQLKKENKELKLQLKAFKDKLCELGVSDVKLYGKRYSTGLEEWLE